MKKKQLIIFLAGGLGNQLFQLSAARSISGGRDIVGEIGFSGDRNPNSSNPAIADLVLAKDIQLRRSQKLRLITQKIFDMLISVSTKTHGLRSRRSVRIALQFFGTIYFSCYYKKIVHVSVSRGIGFYEIPKIPGNQLIIGYFQSYRYSGKMLYSDNNFGIYPVKLGGDFQSLKAQTISEKPIMVHIRLGDYLTEPKFGIPSIEYYKIAIDKLSNLMKRSPIWIFTDDIEQGKKLFAEYLPRNINWINDVDDSIGSTLALFRFGAGYVIANSSFSWWAAWSRHDKSAKVIYPKPWFVGLDTPLDLTPPDWESLPGHVKSAK